LPRLLAGGFLPCKSGEPFHENNKPSPRQSAGPARGWNASCSRRRRPGADAQRRHFRLALQAGLDIAIAKNMRLNFDVERVE
jgi:hypothetical protein